jgi:hypothetical protein
MSFDSKLIELDADNSVYAIHRNLAFTVDQGPKIAVPILSKIFIKRRHLTYTSSITRDMYYVYETND